jgi:N-acetylglucosaminyldiphosphoundecaprenol N-acetyl-beta-D-mannosaminyltransferase
MAIEETASMPPRIDTVTILGVPYDNLSRQETLDRIEVFIRSGARHMICTPNADHLLRARKDTEFRAILNRADLVVSDGMGVIYASRLLGTPLKENVGGRLLLSEFAARAVLRRYRLFLLGGRDSHMAQEAADRLRAQDQGVLVCGSYAPPFAAEFDEAETQRMLNTVEAARPDILFVCLGTPKQEKWIACNLGRLNVPVSIGVGAALDMLTGRVREPPRWATDCGLEWLAKLIQEPGRFWRRYLLGIPVFIWLIFAQWAEAKFSRILE